MQTTLNNSLPELLSSLLIVGLVIIAITFIDKPILESATDITYMLVTGVLVTLSVILSLRFRISGNHGKAWALFLGAATSWCIAETIWTVNQIVYNTNPFPSTADIFYIGGYPFMFLFLMNYLKPVKKGITKKMTIIAVLLSVALTVPSVYMSYSFDPKVSALENILATAYPIADAIMFVPALIGVILFFRGQVNFTWSLICIGILCSAIGDMGFQITEFTNTYYTGHPVDIILIWSYLFYVFGVYDHIKIFGKNKNKITKSTN